MEDKYLIFDLDNTLYSADIGFFKLIDKNISNYMRDKLNIREDLIEEKRLKYFKKFGTTLKGLQLFYEIDPDDFLKYVHDIDVSLFLKKDYELIKMLNNLNYRNIIFSNSNREYILRVLEALGIKDFFEYIIDIKELNYIPKPHLEAYKILLKKIPIKSSYNAAIIDDMVRNLKPARELGFRTIWVQNSMGNTKGLTNVSFSSIENGKVMLLSDYEVNFKSDFVIENILDLEKIISKLWTRT